MPTRDVEGGGPVGCGCGVLLGSAAAITLALGKGVGGAIFVVVVAVVFGFFGWRFGDRFFEKALKGDPEGKPLRYWWFW
jgi:hypothetical protein